jgi:hypothetical protein
MTGGLGNFVIATLEAVGSISLTILGLTFPLWTAVILLSILIIVLITVLTNPPVILNKLRGKESAPKI